MNIIISNLSGKPIYEQISTQIKNAIISEDLSEGTLLPSIRNLAQELKISVITTKRAYEELEHEGFIYTVSGKGSYIAAQNKELLKESRIKTVEDKLNAAIEDSRAINLSLDELKEMLELLYNSNK